AQQHQLLVEWNDTRVAFPDHLCVHELFEAQVAKTPNALAVVQEDKELTYEALNHQANQLAHHLRTLGIQPDDKIAICVERGPAMIIGLLAIMKAGAAYVPMDPAYPLDRLTYMLEDSAPKALLLDHKTKQLLLDTPLVPHRMDIETDAGQWSTQPQTNPLASDISLNPTHLAYIIYTSGSTGKPKGVLVEHRNLNNLVRWHCETFSLKPGQASSCVAGFGFDASGWEIWPTLCAGATLSLPTEKQARDPEQLLAWWEQQPLHISFLPTALAELAFKQGKNNKTLEKLLVGGDSLKHLPDASATFTVFNNYGPTEATVLATSTSIESGSIHIGRPIANTSVYVLDENQQPVPIGVTGELFIGGHGVARGYLNQPELTAERFLPDPFSAEPGARMYKTGDLVRWRADGNLDYIGRNDFQVKLRGFRIELGEIETRLSEHNSVSNAAVVCNTAGDNQRLIAYVTLKEDIKESASLVEESQIAIWQQLYDDTYANTKDPESKSDFIGWNSSYTSEAIPENEMLEWRENTVDRILSLKPKKVLEIGCGTGLLLFQVAPKCSEYVATDLSNETIERLTKKAAALGLDNLQLFHREATNIAGFEENYFDTIIINSVIQYFPTIDYLIEAIGSASKLLTPTGCLFIGDVRNLDLQEAFHSSIQNYRSLPGDSIKTLIARTRHAVASEKELLIAPDFFKALSTRLPEINAVRILPKLGFCLNELTKYRYDVFIHRQSFKNTNDFQEIDLAGNNFTSKELIEYLEKHSPDALLLSNIPNARVAMDVNRLHILKHNQWRETSTLTDLESSLFEAKTIERDLDPQILDELCINAGYSVELSLANTRKPGDFHAFLRRSDISKEPVNFPSHAFSTSDEINYKLFSNNPTQQTSVNYAVDNIRNYLKTQLPDYMVPSHFIVLASLPLTPNGKVDRKALPPPDTDRSSSHYVAPDTDSEKSVAGIWSD
ncbi:MAG: amino acid adenylation domain-containing protein, partial [Arenimonas sp.]